MMTAISTITAYRHHQLHQQVDGKVKSSATASVDANDNAVTVASCKYDFECLLVTTQLLPLTAAAVCIYPSTSSSKTTDDDQSEHNDIADKCPAEMQVNVSTFD